MNRTEKQLALQARFHRMSMTDPMHFTFSKLWSRVWMDRGIGQGLALAELKAQDARIDPRADRPVPISVPFTLVNSGE